MEVLEEDLLEEVEEAPGAAVEGVGEVPGVVLARREERSKFSSEFAS